MTIKKFNNNFETMSTGDAILYCYKHENAFKSDAYACGEDGTQQFDCLIECIESGDIRPNELPDYGMNFN